MNEPQNSLEEWLSWKRWDTNYEGLPSTNLLKDSLRPTLHHVAAYRPWHARAAWALIFMGASIAWVKNATARGWVEPETLVIFQKFKEWECAESTEKAARAAFLRARSFRAGKGNFLDLPARWRGEGAFQWARNMREEFGVGSVGGGPVTRKRYGVRRRTPAQRVAARIREETSALM